jgi:hypothetical protein
MEEKVNIIATVIESDNKNQIGRQVVIWLNIEQYNKLMKSIEAKGVQK